ncbi:MAG: hypothetical protein OSB47_07500 [Pirellulaceae bacterium]|nr:hypothetical protein [Pirellulaceae bacterium]
MRLSWPAVRPVRRSLTWISCLVILVSLVAADQPPRPVNQPAGSPAVEATPDIPPPEIVIDILRLRKQFGNPLSGTLLQEPLPVPGKNARAEKSVEPTEQSFIQALNQVRQAERPGPIRALAPESSPASPVTVASLPTQRSPLQQALRKSWLLLDQRAAELEDLANYQEADQLRELSQKIRIQSRQLTSPRSALQAPDRR